MNTANKITIIRICLIPVFMIALLGGYSWVAALVIFVIAGATDWVDGYIARRYDQITSFGKFIDPLADKLLVLSAILGFVQWGQMPAWAAMLIITREFAVTGLRLVAVSGGEVIAAGFSGKIKTTVSFIGIGFMLTPLHDAYLIPDMLTVDWAAVIAMVVTTLWSGIEYFIVNKGVLKFDESSE